jgi:nitrogen fixation protein FixH
VLLVLSLSSLSAAQDVAAPKLRYDVKPGTTFAYEVNISVELPDSEDKMHGVIQYTVKSSGDEQIEFDFSGHLQSSEKKKAASATNSPRRGGPGGPERFGPRGPLFGSNPITGLTHQTNEVRMAKTGHFVTVKGTSHLPYLLGQLSLLPFERLSKEPQKVWEANIGALIEESSKSDTRTPGPPRLSNNDDKTKKTTAGGETLRYEIQKQEGSKVTVQRTCLLQTAPIEGKNVKLQLATSGTFDFDTDRGLITLSESKGQLSIQQDNVSVDLPLQVNFKLLSDEERQQIEQKKLDQIAAAKQQQEDAAAKLKQPLTDVERKEIINKLETNNTVFVMQTLQMLAKREPAADDKAIAMAIKPHLDSKFPVIRGHAETTWKTWSKLLDEGDAPKFDKAGTAPAAGPNRPARPARPARPNSK